MLYVHTTYTSTWYGSHGNHLVSFHVPIKQQRKVLPSLSQKTGRRESPQVEIARLLATRMRNCYHHGNRLQWSPLDLAKSTWTGYRRSGHRLPASRVASTLEMSVMHVDHLTMSVYICYILWQCRSPTAVVLLLRQPSK